MSTELQDFADQIIELPGFCWMPGMVDEDGGRVLDVEGDVIVVSDCGGSPLHLGRATMAPPDLSDPLTVEALLVLMRERDTGIYMRPNAYGWRVYSPILKEIACAEHYALAVARGALKMLR